MMMKRVVISTLIACLVYGGVSDCSFGERKNVRTPRVAGQFYPGEGKQLTEQIEEYLEQAEKTELAGPLCALVAPHAGYIYSGPTAAYAYKQIENPFKRVFIFASNHSREAKIDGLSVPEYTHYATPLGEVPVSSIASSLLQDERISSVPEAHTTHVIEVQLPFLQVVLGTDFEIIPVITGRIDWNDVEHFGELFNQYVDENTLFIVSTDLSHYHPYKEAVIRDTSCTYALEELDTEALAQSELCGQGAALILLEIAKQRGWKGKILDYRNSGDTAGDKNQVVGYAAIAYYETAESPGTEMSTVPHAASLPREEQRMLLELAQKTVELYVKKQQVFEPESERFLPYRNLIKPQGTFVTLKKEGQLRGCIGDLVGKQPLFLGVRDNAIKAASEDPRFSPVKKEELSQIALSISVLESPQLLEVKTPEEYLTTLTYQDGVILVNGRRHSTYLPQVWEQLPDPAEFLSQLCVKGGSSPDCWKDPETTIYTYRAQEFGKEE